MARASASEQISMAAVLRHFLVCEVSPATSHPAEVLSAVFLCDVVELLLESRSGGSTPKLLEAGVIRHLEQQRKAWDLELWLPKSHYVLHLAAQWAHHGVLLATFVNERKHKEPKRYAEYRNSLDSYEGGLLADVTVQQLWEVGFPLEGVVHHALATPPRELRSMVETIFGDGIAVEVSHGAVVHGREVRAQDVCTYAEEDLVRVGKVGYFVLVNGQSLAVIAPWELVHQDSRSATFRKRDDYRFVSTGALGEAVVFSVDDALRSTILKPWPKAW